MSDQGSEAVFPNGFLWGVATAAYQIEGAVHEGGRGVSVWDVFSHTPGKVRRGDTGDIACDSYHRLDEDLDLLSELGVGGYRFSVAWPRVQPTGSGPANEQGLDYYRRLVDGLLSRGIEPLLTLYHWDLPQPLEDAGGWPIRDTAYRFADFATIVARALGDRVSRWVTINEPQVVADLGYRLGLHAPGRTDWRAAAAATHHLLLGHGLANAVLRAELSEGAEVGITLNLTVVRPISEAAKAIAETIEAEYNRIFLDPVIFGDYPRDSVRPEMLPSQDLIEDGDLAAVGAPIDFLGINYYRPDTVGWRELGEEPRKGEERIEGHRGAVSVTPEGTVHSSMGWPIDAEGLHELLVLLHARAPGLPLYITENGVAAEDYVDPEGRIRDDERVQYLSGHLDACARAIAEGINLRGYFHWSLLDNLEWAAGYQKRFGLYFVDFPTQRRTAKNSAAFYRDVIRRNALPPRDPEDPPPRR